MRITCAHMASENKCTCCWASRSMTAQPTRGAVENRSRVGVPKYVQGKLRFPPTFLTFFFFFFFFFLLIDQISEAPRSSRDLPEIFPDKFVRKILSIIIIFFFLSSKSVVNAASLVQISEVCRSKKIELYLTLTWWLGAHASSCPCC